MKIINKIKNCIWGKHNIISSHLEQEHFSGKLTRIPENRDCFLIGVCSYCGKEELLRTFTFKESIYHQEVKKLKHELKLELKSSFHKHSYHSCITI